MIARVTAGLFAALEAGLVGQDFFVAALRGEGIFDDFVIVEGAEEGFARPEVNSIAQCFAKIQEGNAGADSAGQLDGVLQDGSAGGIQYGGPPAFALAFFIRLDGFGFILVGPVFKVDILSVQGGTREKNPQEDFKAICKVVERDDKLSEKDKPEHEDAQTARKR